MAKGIKTGGRTKGTPNKLTGSLKEMIHQAITDEIETLPELLIKLEPKEKADFIIKLMPYVLPRATSEADDIINGVKQTPYQKYVAQIIEKMEQSKRDQEQSCRTHDNHSR
ncbi:hypothetical protein [Mangrovibacterium diazotrophicum]|uniref:Uncharacterized protein n=1 Tax=Mangrovibacterium diazotrophicum TaxID=1261403 RepID=A0A419WAL0_9BACT|nr:hypothetical protein [Mangrovibacterium diazotrophicum]RKD92521.1 hypothetical protein BC643_2895 [Mangrovibacterium diazotrophicum]